MTGIVAKTIDSRGRLTLGAEFANQFVRIRALKGGVLQVERAEVVPAREAWLFKNPAALAAVNKGLEQAKAGKFVEGPDLEASAAFADGIEDE